MTCLFIPMAASDSCARARAIPSPLIFPHYVYTLIIKLFHLSHSSSFFLLLPPHTHTRSLITLVHIANEYTASAIINFRPTLSSYLTLYLHRLRHFSFILAFCYQYIHKYIAALDNMLICIYTHMCTLLMFIIPLISPRKRSLMH
jgi:hypothetical protein